MKAPEAKPALPKKLLGNAQIHQQYASQWTKALSRCGEPTRKFLSNHSGLFSVQIIGTSANISIEIENDPQMKPQVRNIKEAELQKAFGAVFQKKVEVMFRVAS